MSNIRARFIPYLIGFVAMISIYSCERIYDEPTDNVDEAIAFAADVHVPLHFYRDMEHVFLRLSSRGFFQEVCNEVALEIGADIVLIDSVMAGDDSVFLRIDFNPNKANRFNQLQKSGSIHFAIFSDYTEFGSKQQIYIDSLQPYTYTRRDGLTYEYYGHHTLTRELDKISVLTINRGVLIKKSNLGKVDPWIINAQLYFSTIFGSVGNGLGTALIACEGEGYFEQTNSVKEYNWLISLPLRLNPEFGCANYATSGIVRLDQGFTRYNINFDPFKTNACNKVVEISKGGTLFESKLP